MLRFITVITQSHRMNDKKKSVRGSRTWGDENLENNKLDNLKI